MGSSPILLPKTPLSMMHVVSSLSLLKRILPSHQGSTPKLTECMGNASRRHTLPICEQLLEGSEAKTVPWAEQTLLERMGLGNQTLMLRLGLLLKSCPDPISGMPSLPDLNMMVEGPHSNAPVMMKGMSGVTMPGTGENLEVAHPGVMSMKQLYQSPRKPIDYRTPTSLISSEHSRASNPSRTAQISLPSSGGMSSQTDRSTSEPWLKTGSQGSLHMMKSSTLATMSSSLPEGLVNPKPKSRLTQTGTMPGQNIQRRFYGHTHIGNASSPIMGSTSLGSSWQVLTPITMSSTTKPLENSSTGTRSSLLLILISLQTLPIKSSCPANTEEWLGGGDSNIASSSQGGGCGRNKRK